MSRACALNVFGYDHAPHGYMEIELKDVWVLKSSILLAMPGYEPLSVRAPGAWSEFLT